ncbi:MAG: hypothetical protein AAFW88_12565, partial [Pseudomonadota bacterium]
MVDDSVVISPVSEVTKRSTSSKFNAAGVRNCISIIKFEYSRVVSRLNVDVTGVFHRVPIVQSGGIASVSAVYS